MEWRRQWQPTPVPLPGKFHGWGSLVGWSPWGCKELNTTERLHFLSFYSSFWRRKWQPTPIFLPGKFHGQRSLADYSPWGCKELDTTEHACTSIFSFSCLCLCCTFLGEALISSPVTHMIPSLQYPESSMLSPHPIVTFLYVIVLTLVCISQIMSSELRIALT